MRQFVARWIATCSWIGLSPVAPGTLASVQAAAAFGLMRLCGHGVFVMALLTAMLFPLGLWASEVVSKQLKQTDPQIVVIDEWVAVWGLLLCVPLTMRDYTIAVTLFRLFDISKVWPVGWAERQPGAWGIMLDDVVAAAIAALVMIVVRFLF